MKRFIQISVLFLFALFVNASGNIYAQCVMCRSAIENDQDVAEGVNSGILYLMGIPYIILAVTLYLALKYRKERKAEEE